MSQVPLYTAVAAVLLAACSASHLASQSRSTISPLVLVAAPPGATSAALEDHPVKTLIRHGELEAMMTYSVSRAEGYPDRKSELLVTEHGQAIVDKVFDGVQPTALRIATMPGHHEVVLLDTFTGGAHCCFGTVLVDPLDAGSPSMVTYAWGNTEDRLIKSSDATGYVFLSFDNGMAYAFSDFAGSVMPISIMAYTDGKLVDVTNDYPALVQKDASQIWGSYLKDAHSGASQESTLVAYLADEYRLGQAAKAWERVHAAIGTNREFDAKAMAWLNRNHYAAYRPASRNQTPGALVHQAVTSPGIESSASTSVGDAASSDPCLAGGKWSDHVDDCMNPLKDENCSDSDRSAIVSKMWDAHRLGAEQGIRMAYIAEQLGNGCFVYYKGAPDGGDEALAWRAMGLAAETYLFEWSDARGYPPLPSVEIGDVAKQIQEVLTEPGLTTDDAAALQARLDYLSRSAR